MKSYATEQRLTNVTPNELRKSASVMIRECVKDYARDWGNMTVLAIETGISQNTLSRIKNDANRGITLYTAEKILKAMGKHLEVVDD